MKDLKKELEQTENVDEILRTVKELADRCKNLDEFKQALENILKQEFEQVEDVNILANVIAIVFDVNKNAGEIREDVRKILEKA